MGRPKKNKPEDSLESVSSNQRFASFLKQNKEYHYNFEEEKNYKISSGSLIVDFELGGGFSPGLHRFTGMNEGGKTSEAIEVMRNFLATVPNSRGFYIKAEGRLGEEIRKRSGVQFTSDIDEWTTGNCFVFESNIYETVVEALRNLVYDNPEDTRYFFVLDSVDGLITKNDCEKSFEDARKVAAGAVLASDFMKRVSIALAKRGHIAIFISQVRADINLDPYSKAPVRQTTATGGNALLHFANFILEFEPRYKSDLILEKPNEKYDSQKNKHIGHWAKMTVKKSPNEKTNAQIKYPIIYGRSGGNSIWNEKEILDMMFVWSLAEKKGAGWIEFDADFVKEVSDAGFEFPEKIQGEIQFNKVIEQNDDLKKFLLNYFKKLIMPA